MRAVRIDGDNDSDGEGIVERPALWVVDAFDAERDEVTFELCLESVDGAQPLFVCRADGAPVKSRDAVTFESEADAQPLARWFTWLQRQDALASTQPRADEWAGDDVDAQLGRAEADVVAMDSESALLSVFDSVSAFRAWTGRLSPASMVPLEVFAFDAQAWFDAKAARDEKGMVLLELHEMGYDPAAGDEVAVKWVRASPDPSSAQAWFSTFERDEQPAWFSADTENGATVTSYTAERCIAWAEVEPYVMHEFAASLPLERRWVAARLAGMASVIAMPWADTMVVWMTDRDGASAGLHAEYAPAYLERVREEEEFRLRWARWFDLDRELSPQEISDGIAHVEAAMEEAE